RIGSVLVVEDDGRLIGILTERDLVYLVASDKLHTASEMKVWHLMTENPITVKANETIGDALSKMKEVNIRHLPVVNDEGKPIGIISMRDILDYIISFLDLSFH
ncbi:MAG: CBS domain-containing protein, partial [Fervidicoccus fontis]